MTDPVLTSETPQVARSLEVRAINPSALFWLAMLAASALGTNVGDFWAEGLSLGLVTSFATIAILGGLLVWGDRENGEKTEVFFWLAIVLLRAAATNVGDFLTHNLGINYALATVALGAATLVAGYFTQAGPSRASPLINLRYWLSMFIGGVFGTVGGDLMSHAMGLLAAALVLALVLLATLRTRAIAAPTAIVGYWAIVLAERAAGTPIGDWLASGQGLGLGLVGAMIVNAAVLAAALRIRAGRSVEGVSGLTSASALAAPVIRLGLIGLSAAGCFFMLQILFSQHPRDPTFVLAYAGGLALNGLYLGAQEISALGSSRLARLASLWAAVKRVEFAQWVDRQEASLRARLAKQETQAAE